MKRLEEYITVGTKRLRCGYTTGTCAAAAARAAAELLVWGNEIPAVAVQTPSGVDALVEVESHDAGPGWAECAVRKDAGDDHDVTDGVLVLVRVEWRAEPGIGITGGFGVGRVTRAGLDQPVGEAVINSVPRRMICEQVEAVLSADRPGRGPGDAMLRQSSLGEMPAGHFSRCGTARGIPRPPSGAAATRLEDSAGDAVPLHCKEGILSQRHPERRREAPESKDPASAVDTPLRGMQTSGVEGPLEHEGLLVTISVPEGEELAQRTFNPRLGIVGGISIIGTSGIVRPMSEEALVASIELEMRTIAAAGVRDLLVVPGNYGRDFACNLLGLRGGEAVQCSNYFGATLDAACVLGFERMLIVGHLGKMAKVAAGVMNTHSRVADCRLESLAAHAALAGASQVAVRQIMQSATTDAALDVLYANGIAEATMESLVKALAERLNDRVAGRLQVEAIVFSKVHGVLGQTPGAHALMQCWRDGQKG